MKKFFIFLIVIVFFTISCSTSSNVVRLSPSIRHSVDVDMVTVYQNEIDVPFKFEKIAVVTVKGSAIYKTKKGLMRKLREKAGLIGANAIILSGGKDNTLGTKALSLYFTAGLLGKKEFSAIAIYIYPEREEK